MATKSKSKSKAQRERSSVGGAKTASSAASVETHSRATSAASANSLTQHQQHGGEQIKQPTLGKKSDAGHVQLTPLLGPPAPYDEMRGRWARPTGFWRKLLHATRMTKHRFDFLFGPYFFDWWESLFMYAGILCLVMLLCYGAYKQTTHAIEFILSVLD